MPFDVGFGELIVIGVVALIFIGPKDLPNVFRAVGQFTGRMRAMADDFRRTMEAAADDAGMNDIKKQYRDISKLSESDMGFNDVNQSINDFNSSKVNSIHQSASEMETEIEDSDEAIAQHQKLMQAEAKKPTAKKPAKSNVDEIVKVDVPSKPTKSTAAKTAPKASVKKPKSSEKPT